MLITISGPAGTGKSSIAKNLITKYHYQSVILSTTRDRRPGEIDHKDYHFLNVPDFKQLEKINQFLNVESYTGDRYYAINKDDVKKALYSSDIYILVCTPRAIREIEKEFNVHIDCKLYITSSLNVRAVRYINRLQDKFSLNDLNELVNRSNMDYGKFDGFENEASIIIDNSKDYNAQEFEIFLTKIHDKILEYTYSLEKDDYEPLI